MQLVGDRIRRARRMKGWSQAGLASNLGVSTSAVGHWERPDGHRPSCENLIEIADRLSVRLEWLAVGRGRMYHAGSVDADIGTVLNGEEEALLKSYQNLPSSSRALLMQFIEALAASPEIVARDAKQPRNGTNRRAILG